MNNLNEQILVDVEKVGSISIVPAILEMVCRVTGMGFSAIARVTPEKWVACGVHDNIKFGLKIGGELKVDTTICHEIRQNGDGVIIDHVAEDEFYSTHHTPAMYGFQSYISIPISRADGHFFGTLCAIDPSPAILNTPEIIGLFKAYARLISLHLNAIEYLPQAQVKLQEAHTSSIIKAQYITLFGHDFSDPAKRNQLLVVDRKSKEFAAMIQQSINNINVLISDLKGLVTAD